MAALGTIIDRTPLWACLMLVVFLGLAPFVPEPHVWEKLKLLAAGQLVRPIDMFDLFWHSWPWPLCAVKLARMRRGG